MIGGIAMKQEDFNILTKPEIKVIHKQPVTPNTRVRLSVLKNELKLSDVPIGVSSKICSVYVEMVNNMRMHGAPRKEATAALGVLLLGEDKSMYYLQGSNAIKNERVESVKTQLDRMNSHIKEELRKYYKFRRRMENPNKESVGAGLGIIEIAKRTTNAIEYSFKEIGDEITFFTMLVKLNKGGK